MTRDHETLLRNLLDIEEIKQLKARYFRTLDTRDWNGFGDVFSRDGLLEVPEADATRNGRAEIVAFVSGALEGARTVHHGHMPEIELHGPASASAVWAMEDQRFFEADDPSALWASAIGAGHYHETYVATPEGWRIASLRLTRLRLVFEPLPGAQVIA